MKFSTLRDSHPKAESPPNLLKSPGDSISVISSSSGCALPPPYEEVCEIDLDALPKYEDISQLNLKGQKPIMSV
ncbi:hypothetical protein TCAL_04073 [Tigriopus californicus]|uniref:Uncharacterized protein n=1 Tax=Tigriopus californicus TaxID=6832 RepID=A0A553PG48_TIGCA|nr:hypothetical protein TCAL_04073 [Tigriopus californicus]